MQDATSERSRFGSIDLGADERPREDLFRRLVESLEDQAVFMLDADVRVLTWNKGAKQLTGYSAEEVLGKPCSRLYATESLERGDLKRQLDIARAQGRCVDRCWLIRSDGVPLQAEVVVTALCDGEGGQLRGFSHVFRRASELVDASLTMSTIKDDARKRAQQVLEAVLNSYVGRAKVSRILGGNGSLESEEVEATMMFVDIRGFTSFAERLHPREIVAALNGLFELAVPMIADRAGHVDKFVGDGFLAVFEIGSQKLNHADCALSAARAIARAVGPTLGGHLQIGIGLDSGPVVRANVGGGGRLDFTVVGNAVNTAAHVEAATRKTGDTILITERTRQLLRTTVPMERRILPLNGNQELVTLYAPALRSSNLNERPGADQESLAPSLLNLER
jgi:PAS domain S-box-containing protein